MAAPNLPETLKIASWAAQRRSEALGGPMVNRDLKSTDQKTQQLPPIEVLDTPNAPDDTAVVSHEQWQHAMAKAQTAKADLSSRYTTALLDDFAAHGTTAIEQVRETDPGQYLRLISAVIPKDVNIDVYQNNTASGEQAHLERVRKLRALISTPVGEGLHALGAGGSDPDLQLLNALESED